MKLIVGSVGRLKAGAERELVTRYSARITGLSRAVGITEFKSFEVTESRAAHANSRKREEATALIEKCGESLLIALDERGGAVTSRQFAEHIAQWRDQGQSSIAFIIGGADGLDDTIRDKARLCLSFGAMTLPHQLVRVLVMEQLYRCMTLLTGHPYHRD
jgi:23S rRNA (pseudouridine1915-N3)-methyltransferase